MKLWEIFESDKDYSERQEALLESLEEAEADFEEIDDEEELIEGAKMVWRRKGNKVVKGYRCTTGRKKGRLVDTPADCSKTIDLKKRFKMKKMLQQKGTRIRRKAIRTKKRNPVSMRLQRMNKANRRKL